LVRIWSQPRNLNAFQWRKTWDDYGVVIKAAIACAVIALTGEVLIACTRRKSN
jgi:hypothetical protein